MENLEEVKAKYKLSKEEHNGIFEKIKQIMLFGKFPVEHPKAIIDIAPPGSGKTGLNAYGAKQFNDNNVIIINNDELRKFHPNADEIAKLYPELYTKITSQESNTWTSDLFNFVLEKGYNVIFEGTGRNTVILNTIKNMMNNYYVTVRGMAVNELNCFISILDRYYCQVRSNGSGRLVVLDHFYDKYFGMPNTIDEIEKSGVVDNIEIFMRGEKPDKPIQIYKNGISKMTAKEAVLEGRKKDVINAHEVFLQIEPALTRIISTGNVSDAEIKLFKKIKELDDEYVNSLKEDKKRMK